MIYYLALAACSIIFVILAVLFVRVVAGMIECANTFEDGEL